MIIMIHINGIIFNLKKIIIKMIYKNKKGDNERI